MSSSRARSAPSTFNTIDTQAAQARSMVVIHPFMDGNGRLSRVMAVWALARHGWRKELCSIPLFGQRACISRRQYIQSIRAGRTCPCSEQSPDTLQKCEARCCSGCHREESGGEKFLSCSKCSNYVLITMNKVRDQVACVRFVHVLQ